MDDINILMPVKYLKLHTGFIKNSRKDISNTGYKTLEVKELRNMGIGS